MTDHTPEHAIDRDHRPVEGLDDRDGLVVREERLVVGTERVAGERVVVRTRIVTEDVTFTIPLRREEVEIVRVPVDRATTPTAAVEAGTSTADVDREWTDGERDLRADEQEIVVRAERPVFATEVVEVERIRLVRSVTREEVPVTTEVAREQVEVGHVDPVDGAPRT